MRCQGLEGSSGCKAATPTQYLLHDTGLMPRVRSARSTAPSPRSHLLSRITWPGSSPGTILPVGGMTWGHKGFGMALLIEALTGGLAGHGRADPADGWGATVFLSLYDPAAFGGHAAFDRQMDWLGDACRDNPPRAGFAAVRMPGDRGLSRKREQLQHGVALHPTIAPGLEACAQRYGVPFPAALTE